MNKDKDTYVNITKTNKKNGNSDGCQVATMVVTMVEMMMVVVRGGDHVAVVAWR